MHQGPTPRACIRISCLCRRGFERLIRKLLSMKSSPAVVLLHWWAPLHFKSSFWNVAEDELDTIGSYYDLQVMTSFYSCTYSGHHPFSVAVTPRDGLRPLMGLMWLCLRSKFAVLPLLSPAGADAIRLKQDFARDLRPCKDHSAAIILHAC